MASATAGALRATGSRGLHAAVDHLSENEGNPIPDPSTAGDGDPMQEDEDLGAGGSDPVDAKVRTDSALPSPPCECCFGLRFCILVEYQVQPVREGV